jgi:hypothetical protein
MYNKAKGRFCARPISTFVYIFRSQLIIMQETRNLHQGTHQGKLENITVFSGFREIQF